MTGWIAVRRARRPRTAPPPSSNNRDSRSWRATSCAALVNWTWWRALETCWSCYKQLFAPGLADYTYDLAELGAYWRDYDRLARDWAARAPSHVRAQSIEALQVDPQAQIRDLLAFCRLPFDAACLRFHEARRNIRTPSAAQVRQPLERRASRAAAYGDRLAQLRATLAG